MKLTKQCITMINFLYKTSGENSFSVNNKRGNLGCTINIIGVFLDFHNYRKDALFSVDKTFNKDAKTRIEAISGGAARANSFDQLLLYDLLCIAVKERRNE